VIQTDLEIDYLISTNKRVMAGNSSNTFIPPIAGKVKTAKDNS
jgi:hypothetical protein